jgi:hypothetical protein
MDGGVPATSPAVRSVTSLSPLIERFERAESARVTTALRIRWPWLVIAALLGAVVGGLAVRGVEYRATATLRLGNATDSQQTKQDGQTVKLVAESSPVLSTAARVRNVPVSDLMGRVSAAWVTDTQLVTVSAAAADPKLAVANANAVADAVVQIARDALTNRLAQVRDLAVASLRREVLDDPVAEAARRTQLGTDLAQRQSVLAADVNNVVLFGPAITAERAGLSPTLSAFFGAAGAVLLAALAAVLSKNRKRRIRSRSELLALAPDLVVRTPHHVGEFVARLTESGRNRLVVLALPTAEESAVRLARAISDELREPDRRVAIVDATSSARDQRVVLRHGKQRSLESEFGADVLVTAVQADEVSLASLSGDSSVMAIVVAKLRWNSLAQIRRCAAELVSAKPIVVLVE